MPQSQIDGERALACLRASAARFLGVPDVAEAALAGVLELEAKDLDWEQPARLLGVARRQLKRWFFETYQRHVHEKVSKDDARLLQQMILSLIAANQDFSSKAAQQALHARLSRGYHSQAFYVAYSNAKRLAQQKYQERPEALVDQLKRLIGMQ